MGLLFSLLFALVVAVFAVNNAQPVEVRFLGQSLSTPLVAVIFGSAILGALATIALSLPGRLRERARVRELLRRVSELEATRSAAAPRDPSDDSGRQPTGGPG